MALRLWPRARPSFNYFRAVRATLDAAIPALCEDRELSPDEVRGLMLKHLKKFSDEYRSQRKPDNPYEDPICRTAYLYCYVAANANLCEIAIKRSEDLHELIKERLDEEGELKVCAFGGGPGTELLALSKHLVATRKGPPVALFFTLLDSVEEWAETWSLLEQEIKAFLKKEFGKVPSWPFTVSRSFVPFDITDLSKYGNIKQLFGQDLTCPPFLVHS